MKSDFKIAAVILIIFVMTIGYIIIGGDSIGLTDEDASRVVTLLPGIGVILVSFWAATQARGIMLSGAVMGVGLGFIFLIHLMDSVELLVSDLQMSVADLQLVILIVFAILSAGLVVAER